MVSKRVELDDEEDGHASTYSTRYFTASVPKFCIPDRGMPADAAYQLVSDELDLDGNPSLNLASFVTTWMEPEARRLVMENIHKNFIDHFEYPQTEVIHERLVNMVARLFNAPEDDFVGTATVGSSEAIMLGLLAHKWNWRQRRQEAGEDAGKPNIIFGADTHICWDKFARYFDVEARIIPMTEDRYAISTEEVADRVDANTIAVGAVVGTTFTGESDPVEAIDALLRDLRDDDGLNIPMHVDAASGGFVTPFTEPDYVWDFRLEQVRSINVSGHKYGLVYPGLGWLVFRNTCDLPEDLVFNVNYLGDEMPTFTLNFSKGSAMVLAQYYNMVRLGWEGYSRIASNMMENARYLSQMLEATGHFAMLKGDNHLPIVAVRLVGDRGYDVFDVSSTMRQKGWIIPAYRLPPNAERMGIMRVVVRENFSRDMADMLVKDILWALERLDSSGGIGGLPDCDPRKGHHMT